MNGKWLETNVLELLKHLAYNMCQGDHPFERRLSGSDFCAGLYSICVVFAVRQIVFAERLGSPIIVHNMRWSAMA